MSSIVLDARDIESIRDNPLSAWGSRVCPKEKRQPKGKQIVTTMSSSWWLVLQRNKVALVLYHSLQAIKQSLFSCLLLQWPPTSLRKLWPQPPSSSHPNLHLLCPFLPSYFLILPSKLTSPLMLPTTSGALLHQIHQPIYSPHFLPSLISLSWTHRLIHFS